MSKLDFEAALEKIGDDSPVAREDVRAAALRRKVWVAEWHLPGCLSESRSVCLTKDAAIEAACSMAQGEDGVPRGMVTALRRDGRFETDSPLYGTCVNTISCKTLADIL